ncbi:MAG: orotidine-5'-phosphate decarboxylase [Cytophagales bacterium]|nr:orotidine-5'-phosphate decarboxylase [Cytophagales bacterium]MDW8384566.1 orotidine-5'-phosphate decarboxylase [Flammeovirgaceae bacterium]
MTQQELVALIKKKKSYLCVGLDTDVCKIPSHLKTSKDPVFEFNKQIIDATIEYAVAYKPNIAFYEALGSRGWESLYKTMDYLPKNVFTIADAKRGDIGNTSEMYAKTFFEHMNFDAITVAPYMGADSVLPFLKFPNKWVILLALTSNQGSCDFQQLILQNGRPLYQEVILKSQAWASENQMMYVVGATHIEHLKETRKIAPHHFLLVPGVGAQGGSLEEVSNVALNAANIGILVNVSRQILYTSPSQDFFIQAKKQAKALQETMASFLDS